MIDLAGKFVRYDGADWPIPETRWEALYPAPDGTLALATPTQTAQQSYPAVPTWSGASRTTLLETSPSGSAAPGSHANTLRFAWPMKPQPAQ